MLRPTTGQETKQKLVAPPKIRAAIAGRWPEIPRRMPSTTATPMASATIPTRGGLSAIVGELGTTMAFAWSGGDESALAICAATTMTAVKSAIPTIALTIAVPRTDEACRSAMTATTTARQPVTNEIVGDWPNPSKTRLCPHAINFGNGPETDMTAMNVATLATASTNASNPGQLRVARIVVVSFIRRPASGWPQSSPAHRSRIQHQHPAPRHPEEGQGAA